MIKEEKKKDEFDLWVTIVNMLKIDIIRIAISNTKYNYELLKKQLWVTQKTIWQYLQALSVWPHSTFHVKLSNNMNREKRGNQVECEQIKYVIACDIAA